MTPSTRLTRKRAGRTSAKTALGPNTPKDLFLRLEASVRVLEGPLRHRWKFGESEIAIQIWGSQASPFDAAIEPATGPSKRPIYVIDVIDAESTGVPWPGIQLVSEDFGRGRRLDRWSDDRFESFALKEEKGIAVADQHARRAIVWLPSLNKVDPREQGAPFRWLAEGIAGAAGQGILHCAAIGRSGRAALVVGHAGAGKSTLALTALGAGWSYFGDDYVLVSADPEPRCFRIYRSAKWVRTASTLPAWISRDGGMAADSVNRKRMTFFDETSPALAEENSAVTLVVRPKIDPSLAAPTMAAANPRVLAMGGVLSTMAQSHVLNAPIFAPLTAIARRVPCRELRLSTDLVANLDLLGNNLDQLT